MNKPKLLPFETERLAAFEVSMGDLEKVHQLHSIPEVDEFNTLGIPENIEVTKKLLEAIVEKQKEMPRTAFTWKIVLKETEEFVGMAGFFLSNDKFKLGEIYYKFDPKHWGKGYATELARRMVVLGFEEFKLHKVEAGVACGNSKSIRVLEKTGMTREGLRRKILPIRGEWVDNYHYAIVEDDPRNY